MKVSVIVPVYNAKQYLCKCLDSIIQQTLKEIEIIIINDGSTDESKEIIDEYINKDARIRVIHNNNHGYGYSVNYGIRQARGTYIGIVEADDCIESNMYERLYQSAIINDLDFIKSDRKEAFELFNGSERVIRRKNINFEKLYNTIFKPLEHLEFYFSAPDTWSGIYNREFLLKNQIWHNETDGASYQDIGFAFQVYTLAEKCMLLDEAFYHYKIDNLMSSIHSREKVFTVCKEYDFVLKFLEKCNKEVQIKVYPAYFVKRYGAYLSTIRRIDTKYLLQFLKVFKEDYLRDKDKEYFNELLFDKEKLVRINEILESPENYYKRYLLTNKRIYEEIVSRYNKIIIYGAGKKGIELWKSWGFVNEEKIGPRFCFAVSNNPEKAWIDDIPIYNINSLISYKEDSFVIIAVGEKYKEELISNVRKLGFFNYIFLADFWEQAKIIRKNKLKDYTRNERRN